MVVRRCLWLFLIAFGVYNLNLRPIPAGDTTPAALLPLTLLAEHTFRFDRFADWYTARNMPPVWFVRAGDGHYYSGYPVALPLLVTPLYIPVVAAVDVRRMPVERVVLLARVLEKVTASLIAALSVVAFFVLAAKLSSVRTAWLLILVYGFGSETWSISSQALWQHGATELAVILTLVCVVRARERPGTYLPAALAGLCAGMCVALRLSNGIFLSVIAGYVLVSGWSLARKMAFAASAAAPVAMCLGYNASLFGDWMGGYRGIGMFQGNLLTGLAGLLVSPSRGLLVFCPVFIFSAAGVWLWLRGARTPHSEFYWISAAAVAGELGMLGLSQWWWGGYSYGPRLLTDVVPCLTILLIPAADLAERARGWRFALGCAVFVSIAIQAIGVFCYPNGHWDALPQPVTEHQERLWVWSDNQILRSVRAGPVSAPYRLAWNFLRHPGTQAEESLAGQGLKLW